MEKLSRGPVYKDQMRDVENAARHHQGIFHGLFNKQEQVEAPDVAAANDPGLPVAILTAELVDDDSRSERNNRKKNGNTHCFCCKSTLCIVLVVLGVMALGGAATGILCTRSGKCGSAPSSAANSDDAPTTSLDYCGSGKVGNGICQASTNSSFVCCSTFGWCGIGDEHCRAIAPAGGGDDDFCGDGRIGNGNCTDPDLCCSMHGFCGTGADYCNNGTDQQQQESSMYCGQGSPGNGQCEDATLCCSKFFFCGSGADYCG
jgi:hypothetical protein